MRRASLWRWGAPALSWAPWGGRDRREAFTLASLADFSRWFAHRCVRPTTIAYNRSAVCAPRYGG